MLDRTTTRLKDWARAVKRDVCAVWLAARDPRVPWIAKALGIVIAGYALSPIDLIPDFVPVLGYLDDAVLLPLGIALVVWLIPPDIMAEHRAAAATAHLPVSRTAGVVVVLLWTSSIVGAMWLALRAFAG
ncbi:MAG: DUF1232 domain-containing protein [Rhodoplanes sp.]|uniref:YkvA family protein n=1 Tax=Rhodoplanes sp. TaxID=1968906 RepID=UPI001852A477|nr:YkvA family protein [Rhodoplanes sp.]NVO16096.1 DUF1232 domain-containing protein [Rhodoplanes sp.]